MSGLIDPVTAMRTFWQQQPDLTSITTPDSDKGIYRANPKGLTGQTARKCVVVDGKGGVVHDHPQIDAEMYIRCYGETDAAAWEVYRRLWGTLYKPDGSAYGSRIIAGRWLLKSATLRLPISTVEPEGWSVVIARLTAQFDPTHDGLGG